METHLLVKNGLVPPNPPPSPRHPPPAMTVPPYRPRGWYTNIGVHRKRTETQWQTRANEERRRKASMCLWKHDEECLWLRSQNGAEGHVARPLPPCHSAGYGSPVQTPFSHSVMWTEMGGDAQRLPRRMLRRGGMGWARSPTKQSRWRLSPPAVKHFGVGQGRGGG